MEEVRVRGLGHQRLIDLIGLKRAAPISGLAIAHRNPDVGVDDVGTGNCGVRIIGFNDLCEGEPVTGGTGDDELRARQCAALSERPGDIVAVTDKCDLYALHPAHQLPDGKQVGERLKRVIAARKHIEHRRRTNRRKFFKHRMIEYPRRDDRVITGERAGDVGNALTAADAELRRLEIDRVAAKLDHRHLHRIAGPRARLLKIQSDALAEKGAWGGRFGQSEDLGQVGGVQLVDRQQVPHGCLSCVIIVPTP